MTTNDVAKALLTRLSLPSGVATVLPWQEGSRVVMHVYVDPQYIRRVELPKVFQGYPVVLEERQPSIAHH